MELTTAVTKAKRAEANLGKAVSLHDQYSRSLTREKARLSAARQAELVPSAPSEIGRIREGWLKCLCVGVGRASV